jgi:hypothetical protein
LTYNYVFINGGNLKFAILSNDEDSFVKPISEGLKNSLNRLQIECDVFSNGHDILNNVKWIKFYTYEMLKSIIMAKRQQFIAAIKGFIDNYRFIETMKQYDGIILTAHLPTVFIANQYPKIEMIRSKTNIPIINYDLVYLPTRGKWFDRIKKDNPDNFGLERFDYYLAVSAISEYALSSDNHPLTIIGCNLNDGSLFPAEKSDFIALLDFERTDHLGERSIQIQALKETNTEYIELKGSYPMEEIRKIYRKCSMYFLAHRESFGLPICELQACGCYVMLPYKNWAPSHYINKKLKVSGEGDLSSNFIIYDNDIEKLKQQIMSIKKTYNRFDVYNTFVDNHSKYLNCDLEELKKFINNFSNNNISSNSHKSYAILNNTIDSNSYNL